MEIVFNSANVFILPILDESLYIYRDRSKVAKSKSRGKINLKDYMFDEDNNQK